MGTILLLGTTGSGKSFLANLLRHPQYSLPFATSDGPESNTHQCLKQSSCIPYWNVLDSPSLYYFTQDNSSTIQKAFESCFPIIKIVFVMTSMGGRLGIDDLNLIKCILLAFPIQCHYGVIVNDWGYETSHQHRFESFLRDSLKKHPMVSAPDNTMFFPRITSSHHLEWVTKLHQVSCAVGVWGGA